MGASFEELEVWKAGCRLAVAVLQEMQTCTFYGLRDQMVKSALSIPSNIAEGSERRTTKDFSHFLHIALGSAAELRPKPTSPGKPALSLPKSPGSGSLN
jgi:hypothetical protein